MADENPYLQYTQSPQPSTSPKPEDNVNPYLQYAKPPSNLYDRTLPAATTPKKYTLGEAVSTGIENLPNSGTKFITGVRDALIHPINTGKALLSLAGGIGPAIGAKLAGDKMTPEQQESLAKDHPELKHMIDTANSVGGMYKDRYGDWDSIKRTLAEDPVGFAADLASVLTLPGVGTAARTAGNTAARVLPTPIVRGAELVKDVLVPTQTANKVANVVASRAVPAAARYAEDVMHPTNALVRRMGEGQLPDVYNALISPTGHEIVPGSVPTGATAVMRGPGDLTATRLQAAGAAAERNLSTEAKNIRNTQNAARLAHNQQTFGTPADLEAAVNNRQAVSDANYAVANGVMSTVDNNLTNLLHRPAIAQAFNNIEQSVANTGRPFGTRTANGQLQFSGQELHRVKQELDSIARQNFKDHGAEAAATRDAFEARNAFVNWVEQNNNAYRIARETHRDLSVPIDQMRVGQHMASKLTDLALGEATPTQRAAAYAQAMDNAANESGINTTVRNATGQQRYQHIRDLMTPDQMDILRLPQQDLARELLADIDARAGTPSFGSAIDTVVSDALHVKPSNKVANFFLSGANKHVSDAVSRAMLTPGGLQQLVRNALVRDAQLGQYSARYGLANRVHNALNPYAAMNEYPTIYNALQHEDQKR